MAAASVCSLTAPSVPPAQPPTPKYRNCVAGSLNPLCDASANNKNQESICGPCREGLVDVSGIRHKALPTLYKERRLCFLVRDKVSIPYSFRHRLRAYPLKWRATPTDTVTGDDNDNENESPLPAALLVFGNDDMLARVRNAQFDQDNKKAVKAKRVWAVIEAALLPEQDQQRMLPASGVPFHYGRGSRAGFHPHLVVRGAQTTFESKPTNCLCPECQKTTATPATTPAPSTTTKKKQKTKTKTKRKASQKKKRRLDEDDDDDQQPQHDQREKKRREGCDELSPSTWEAYPQAVPAVVVRGPSAARIPFGLATVCFLFPPSNATTHSEHIAATQFVWNGVEHVFYPPALPAHVSALPMISARVYVCFDDVEICCGAFHYHQETVCEQQFLHHHHHLREQEHASSEDASNTNVVDLFMSGSESFSTPGPYATVFSYQRDDASPPSDTAAQRHQRRGEQREQGPAPVSSLCFGRESTSTTLAMGHDDGSITVRYNYNEDSDDEEDYDDDEEEQEEKELDEEKKQQKKLSNRIVSMDMSNSMLLAATQRALAVWRLDDNDNAMATLPMTSDPSLIEAVSLGRLGDTFLTGKRQELSVWSMGQGGQLETCLPADRVTAASFAPDNERVVAYSSESGSVNVVDRRSLDRMCSDDADSKAASDMQWLRDGRHIVSRNVDCVKVWDLHQHQRPLEVYYALPDGGQGTIAASSDGQNLLTDALDGACVISRSPSSTPTTIPLPGPVRAVSWAPDDEFALVGGEFGMERFHL